MRRSEEESSLDRIIHSVVLGILVFVIFSAALGGVAGADPPTVITAEEALERAVKHHSKILKAIEELENTVYRLEKARVSYSPGVTMSAVPLSLGEEGLLKLPSARLIAELEHLSGLTARGELRGSFEEKEEYSLRLSWSYILLRDPGLQPAQQRLSEMESEVEISEHRLELLKKEIQIEVLELLFAREIEERNYLIALDEKQEAKKRLGEVEEKVKQGAGGGVDLLSAELKLKEAELKADQTKRSLDQRNRDLFEILGLSEVDNYEIQAIVSIPVLEPLSEKKLEKYVANALKSSIELMEIEIVKERALRALDAEKEKIWPQIILRGEYNFDYELADKNDDRKNFEENWSIFLEINHALRDGGLGRLELEEKESDLQAVVRRYDEQKEQIRKEVHSLWEDLLSAAGEVRVMELKLKRASLELEQGAELLDKGIMSIEDYHRLQKEYEGIEFDLRRYQYNQFILKLKLEVLSGAELEGSELW